MSIHQYDHAWANRVVLKFEREYPEACINVNRILRVEREKVVEILQSNQKCWRLYKRLVKSTDAVAQNKEVLKRYREEFYEYYYTNVK